MELWSAHNADGLVVWAQMATDDDADDDDDDEDEDDDEVFDRKELLARNPSP